jgi:hypothetical protein
MFDFYQVEHISVEFVPYKFELTGSTTGVNPINARPVYSCVDPETSAPLTASAIASYGNLKYAPPYKVLKRSLPYHSLGIQKQDKLILPTNGANGSRGVYSDPACIIMHGENPCFKAEPFGSVIFTIHYVFSGQRNPSTNSQVLQPQNGD